MGLPVAALREGGELLRVPLLHQPEATELPLQAIEVAVVVSVASDEAVAADVVIGLHPLHDVDGKGEARDPGPARQPVRLVEPGGGSVEDAGLGPQIVVDAGEQVRLLATGDVHVLGVLGPVLVDDGVALAVVALADEAGEDAPGLLRIGDATLQATAVAGSNAIAGDGAPEAVGRAGGVRPSFDPSEEAFDTRPVALDAILGAAHGAPLLPAASVLPQDGDQVFRPGEDEDIGLLIVPVAGQALAGLATGPGGRQ